MEPDALEESVRDLVRTGQQQVGPRWEANVRLQGMPSNHVHSQLGATGESPLRVNEQERANEQSDDQGRGSPSGRTRGTKRPRHGKMAKAPAVQLSSSPSLRMT